MKRIAVTSWLTFSQIVALLREHGQVQMPNRSCARALVAAARRSGLAAETSDADNRLVKWMKKDNPALQR